jgi:hypothetical protein
LIEIHHEKDTYNFDLTATLGNAHAVSCSSEGKPGGNGKVWSTLVSNYDNSCYNISADAPTLAFIDESKENSGLRISFPKNAHEEQQTYPKRLVIDLVCNKSMSMNDTAIFTLDSIDEIEGIIKISGESYYGCPYFTLNQFFNFLQANQYPFIAVCVVLGIFFTFFGLQVFNVTVFLITTIAGTFVSGILFFEFVKFGTQSWILWVIFGTCLTIGAVLGYLAVKYEKLGFFALGSYLGVIGGLLLYNTILIHVMHDGQNGLFYVIIAACGIIGGGIAIWLWKDVIIIATSIIGSYMTVRALSVLIGGFPNEIAVVNGAEELNLNAYLYLLGIALKAFLGMYFQFKQKRKREEEEDEKESMQAYRRV